MNGADSAAIKQGKVLLGSKLPIIPEEEAFAD